MQQHKKSWGSFAKWVPVVAGVLMLIALVFTWGLVGVGQTAQRPTPLVDISQLPPSIVPGGTPQVTIPYPTWGDGTDVDHLQPGRVWETAYQPDKWPSERQRAYVKQLENYEPDDYTAWGKRMNQALTNKKLDKRYEALINAATASMAYWARPVIERYIDQAFDAGSNANEIMAAIDSSPEANGHSAHDGLGALWFVYHTRQAAGKPVPLTGPPLTEKDLIPASAFTPVLFKYQLPNPRARDLARKKFNPEGWEMDRRHSEEDRKLPQYLSAHLQELIWIASDTAVLRWPDPLVDHHHHQALNRGSNLQEIVEVMMVAAEVVQGAADSNVAGRRVPTGMEILHHGLLALSRVVAERNRAGYKTPAEYGEGFTKKMY